MQVQIPNYLDPQYWSLVTREIAVVQRPSENTWIPLPTRNYVIEGRVLLVGMKNPKAKSNWKLGCWLHCLAPPVVQSSPASFPEEAQIFSTPIPLGRLKLVVLPRLADSYLIELKFPHWHQEALYEIRRYSGPVTDVFDAIAAGGGGGGLGQNGLGGFGAVIG